jgi:hypothetical protein
LERELKTEFEKADPSPKVLALLSRGIAKLLFVGVITNPEASPNRSRFLVIRLSD